ncbi:recombinase family protein [Mycobacterium asiaticum]|uniref:recombinase family protein n=1 Tax=Mycobacterium asiaticum TaxID=1790 RepID=UPI00068585C6|nr:recombinase family protein [Mycobacterium asiaticum]
MRAAIYLRQSQDRTGDGLGIDRQRDEVRQLITARGWTVAGEFVDNDVSALSRKSRPQFDRMMARVDAGEFDVIVARHIDRLLRRLAELENVLERCQATNTAVVTAADGVDTSSDGGRLVARILSSVAQGEVERKGARQRSAAVQAAQQGRWVGGRRAFGYEADGVTVREDEAALIKQGYADLLAGESISEIARRWNAAGAVTGQGHEWRRGAVKDVLTNPRNAGLRRYRPTEDRWKVRVNPELGITGTAEWPGIVDETTWRAAVRKLSDPARRRAPIGGKGLLTGLAVCGVCAETVHRGGASHHKPMYRCRSGRHVGRMSEPVDEYVTEVVLARLTQPDAAELWAAELPDASELMAEADTLRRRRDDLALDYADGAMTREQFRAANTRVLERLGELEARIAAAGTTSPLAIVAAADVRGTWATLSTAQRRAIIAALMTPALHLVGAGVRNFRPESVEIRWKVGA